MDKTAITMSHPDSETTIEVSRGSVANAMARGWVPVTDEQPKKIGAKTVVSQDKVGNTD